MDKYREEYKRTFKDEQILDCSKVPVVTKDKIIPFILITSLFALWGFANDITNPMVSAFKKVMELDNFKASLVQLAFYGGYGTMALPAAIFIKKYSYKKGILTGLALYAIGALLFYPAAVYQEYFYFLLALYILTFGLAFLETTANPYILAMGDERTSTRRLNLAQAFNPIGALAGLYVAQTFVLGALQSDDVNFLALSDEAKSLIKTSDLLVIRDPYVGLGVFVLLMLVIIAFVKMPEYNENKKSNVWSGIKRLFKKERFVGGVIAQTFYVGAQIMCWTYIYQYAEVLGINNQTTVYYAMSALGVFLGGRWICTFLLKYINSAKLLFFLSLGAMVFTLGAIFIKGMGGLYSLVAVSFCMSLMFPTIYGIALMGLGDDAKYGSAFLVMAIVGGAIMPSLQGLILDIGGPGYNDVAILGVPEVNFSFILPLICYLIVALYGYRAINYK
ncbi:L-fucose:H+ symporter permease [Salegentibacter sp. BLCTC]|uniref:L-fucose:H+ symporter permease n=1 Tax=Salegentibacter sp. BLCTC TaxID=2697368 RepID=UPI00187B7726|nr:L-fucose:H+ symporter permease [Salegentibacter sp. BLCTC]MBE7639109.1 L-fucose:H+ symporter permease [Salegentibacter sp. BLCTC]